MARGAPIAELESDVRPAPGACSEGAGLDLAGAVEVAAGEPDRLGPHSTGACSTLRVPRHVHGAPVEPGEDLELQPALPESREGGEDRLSGTCRLREGAGFHGGCGSTAEDVVCSCDRTVGEQLADACRPAALEHAETVPPPVPLPGTGSTSREHLTTGIRLPVVQASGRGNRPAARTRTDHARTPPWAGSSSGGSSGT